MSFRLLLMEPLTSMMKKILHFKGQLLVLSLNYCMVNISDDGLILFVSKQISNLKLSFEAKK